MMTEKEKEALRKWYSQEWALRAVRMAHEAEDWETIEAHVHRDLLFPLGKHKELPDYMRNEEGGPLFPSNLNPLHDMEGWEAATEVGWAVMKDRLDISKEEVQGKIRADQEKDWQVFLKSVEERKKAKDQKP